MMGNPLPSQQKGTAEGCEYCSNLFRTGLPFFIGYTNWFSLVAKHTYLRVSNWLHPPEIKAKENMSSPLFHQKLIGLEGSQQTTSRKMSFLGAGTWPLADIFPAETSTFVTNMRVQPA